MSDAPPRDDDGAGSSPGADASRGLDRLLIERVGVPAPSRRETATPAAAPEPADDPSDEDRPVSPRAAAEDEAPASAGPEPGATTSGLRPPLRGAGSRERWSHRLQGAVVGALAATALLLPFLWSEPEAPPPASDAPSSDLLSRADPVPLAAPNGPEPRMEAVAPAALEPEDEPPPALLRPSGEGEGDANASPGEAEREAATRPDAARPRADAPGPPLEPGGALPNAAAAPRPPEPAPAAAPSPLLPENGAPETEETEAGAGTTAETPLAAEVAPFRPTLPPSRETLAPPDDPPAAAPATEAEAAEADPLGGEEDGPAEGFAAPLPVPRP